MSDSEYSGLPPELAVTSNGAVRVVTLNRPDRRNSFDASMHAALAEVWLILERDADARAVLIRAEGEIFTAGGDYEWFRQQQRDRSLMEASMADGRRILQRMVACRLPVVMAVQGGAVGLGASMGILADIVVMSDDAFYRDPHVALGLAAADGGLAWARSTSMQVAKQYLLLGDRLVAQEAFRLGMVNEVTPRDLLDERAMHFAQRLAQLPVRAAEATKRAFAMVLERELTGPAEYLLAVEHLCALDPSYGETASSLGSAGGSAQS